MSIYAKFARAFQIFAEYDQVEEGSVAVEHDQMWAGPDPTHVSAEHVAELKALGWHPDQRHDCWQRWV